MSEPDEWTYHGATSGEPIEELVTQADRAWFDAHPEARAMTRPYVEGEFSTGALGLPGGVEALVGPRPDLNAILMIEVRKQAPGMRTRQPAFWVVNTTGDPDARPPVMQTE